MIIAEESYLEHYGKKGMKWGVRRERQRAFQSPYKVKSVKRSELTGPQRRAVKFIEKNQRRGRTKKEIKVGNRAANRMLKQFGGIRIGSMWAPDRRYLENLGRFDETTAGKEQAAKTADRKKRATSAGVRVAARTANFYT